SGVNSKSQSVNKALTNLKIRTMKYLFLACSVLLLFITACSLNDYDNYDTPDAIFEGNIVYEGDPIPVGYNSVSFELWQSGFGKETPIDVTVAQDGSFSAKLFSGKYRLVLKEDQGPYLSPTNTETNSDSIMVDLNGNKSSDIEVLPYYMIRNASFSISDRNVSASFEVEKIMDSENGGKPVESVSLYISKTQFVDERTSISSNIVAATEISDMSNININTDVPELTPEQG